MTNVRPNRYITAIDSRTLELLPIIRLCLMRALRTQIIIAPMWPATLNPLLTQEQIRLSKDNQYIFKNYQHHYEQCLKQMAFRNTKLLFFKMFPYFRQLRAQIIFKYKCFF